MGKLQAFVIMPFDPEFDEVYSHLIAKPLEDAGFAVRRADNVDTMQNVLADVVRGIDEADLVVADMTTGNANVFYELGLAHAMGVPTVLIAEQNAADEIPFDLRQYRTEFYETHFQRAESIRQALSNLAAAHAADAVTFGSPVSDFLPGAARPMVRARRSETIDAASLELSIRNGSSSEKTADSSKSSENSPDEPLGLLDFDEAIEKAADDFSGVLAQVNDITERVGTNLSSLSGELSEVDPSAPAASSHVKRLLQRVATLLNEYADDLAACDVEIEAGVDGITSNGLGLLTLLAERPTQHADQIKAVLAVSVDLRTPVADGTRGMIELRDAVAELPPIVSQVIRARDRTVRSLDGIIAQFERVRSYAEQAVSIAEAALGAAEQTDISETSPSA